MTVTSRKDGEVVTCRVALHHPVPGESDLSVMGLQERIASSVERALRSVQHEAEKAGGELEEPRVTLYVDVSARLRLDGGATGVSPSDDVSSEPRASVSAGMGGRGEGQEGQGRVDGRGD